MIKAMEKADFQKKKTGFYYESYKLPYDEHPPPQLEQLEPPLSPPPS